MVIGISLLKSHDEFLQETVVIIIFHAGVLGTLSLQMVVRNKGMNEHHEKRQHTYRNTDKFKSKVVVASELFHVINNDTKVPNVLDYDEPLIEKRHFY